MNTVLKSGDADETFYTLWGEKYTKEKFMLLILEISINYDFSIYNIWLNTFIFT